MMRKFVIGNSLIHMAVAACAAWGQAPNADPQALAPSAPAQPLRVSALDITGRDFAGIRFPGQIQDADIKLFGARAFVWDEAAPSDGSGPGVRRIYLQGDVRAEIGLYNFTAAQAVVWLLPLDAAAAPLVDAGAGAERADRSYQVAVYFDRVSDPGAEAGFAQAGDRLLVTGLVRGKTVLEPDLLTKGRPAAAFIRESEKRLARELRRLSGVTDEADLPSAPSDGVGKPRGRIVPGFARPFEPDSAFTTADQPAILPSDLAPTDQTQPIFSKGGILTIAVGTALPTVPTIPPPEAPPKPDDPVAPPATTPARNDLIRHFATPEENRVVFTGGVVVQYAESARPRTLGITAQRTVLFLEPGPLIGLAKFDISKVRGIYAEGDVVATDGTYTLRGPRVYYDVQNNRAVMPDAVFFTYDQRRGLPLYVRAAAVRQLAANQFGASEARLSTTSFFDPMLSIGAKDATVTVTETPTRDGATTEQSNYIETKGMTLLAGGVPIMIFPNFKGSLDNFPLRDIRLENSSNSGTAFKTSWDIFGLTATKPPDGVDSVLLLDWFFDRGPAFGNRTSWSNASAEGQLFTYILPDDYGTDVLSSGVKRGIDNEFRGMIAGEHRWTIDDKWTAFLEGNYISDENFVDAFFKPLAYEGREFTNAAYLRRLDDNTALTLLAKTEFNDFTPNQYLLQAPGFNTDKLPELGYFRLADDLLAGSAPGLLSYSSEYRLSRMQLHFTEPTADELGFNTVPRSQNAFGINPNQSIADRLRSEGYNEDPVLRFDTRHELSATLDFDPLKVTPFAVGRFTAYDTSFDTFTSDFEDQYRLWYAGGVRVATDITRVNDLIDSRIFDLHRTRHIIEPHVTLWSAGANVGQNDLPAYDLSVESLATGTAVDLGVSQTWQTMRGGEGRWRSVDFFKLDMDLVYSTGDADQESAIPRFIDYRPEYSLLGNYFSTQAAWQVTDAVALVGSTIYDFDIDQPARTTAGGIIQHSPEFSSYAEMRYVNALDVTYVSFGASYQLTRRYYASFYTTYDTVAEEFQSFSATIKRRMPEATLGVRVGYDSITDETSFSAVLEPAGLKADNLSRLRDIGR